MPVRLHSVIRTWESFGGVGILNCLGGIFDVDDGRSPQPVIYDNLNDISGKLVSLYPRYET